MNQPTKGGFFTLPLDIQPQPSASSSAGTESMSISKLTQEIGEFEMFSALLPVADLEGAKLGETLTQGGDYTVFVPTDKAFAALPAGVVSMLVKPENRDLLVEILSYHIVPNKITSQEIKTGEMVSLDGQPIAIQTNGAVGSVMVNEAQVIQPDIQASNGVIHAIDKVMLPPDVMARISAPSEMTPGTTPEGTTPEVMPGTTPEVTPGTAPEIAPGTTPEVAPEAAPAPTP